MFSRTMSAAFAVAGLLGAFAISAQDSQDGRQLYVAYGCYQCHGYEGHGGVAGPRIGPSPYPLAAFAALVRRPSNVMPAYAPSVLDDPALEMIYEYMRSRPMPADDEEIALLQ
jgi:mono/diheme cytochrome c family protein